jgi:hypothetical protein
MKLKAISYQDVVPLAHCYSILKDDKISEPVIKLFRSIVDKHFEALPMTVKLERDELSYEQVKAQWDIGILPISDLNSNNTLLGHVGNFRFRAVHDYHHSLLGANFSFNSEYNTFKYFVSLLELSAVEFDIIVKILFSEIVLQAAYFEHYRAFPLSQKVVLTNMVYGYI